MFKKLFHVGESNQQEFQIPQTLIFEIDEEFNSLYERGMHLSFTPDSGERRRSRFYNLINLLKITHHLDGAVVECGCWKGLSSFLMCNYLKKDNINYVGDDYYIIDSFEGLSKPTSQDIISRDLIDKKGSRKGAAFKQSGAYSANIDAVRNILSEYPSINYHKGWIPNCLSELYVEKVKFVHIDLDLYEPIIGALEYFYPKLATGGVIVCDDYGSLYWPGAQKAVEEFALNNSLQFVALSTGQAMFIKNTRS
jgi:O-methyltransferase